MIRGMEGKSHCCIARLRDRRPSSQQGVPSYVTAMLSCSGGEVAVAGQCTQLGRKIATRRCVEIIARCNSGQNVASHAAMSAQGLPHEKQTEVVCARTGGEWRHGSESQTLLTAPTSSCSASLNPGTDRVGANERSSSETSPR